MASPSLDDTVDFENIDRGFIDTLNPCIIKSKEGRVVWNNEDFAFLRGSRPETVNAKLWRQSQLCLKHGLFQVTDGIYQVRGFDLSNITFIEGSSGVIVMDPLVSTECAQAALALYHNNRGNRPVKAVIYTHSHIDHFGGVLGVLPESYDEQRHIPIIAPEGFMEEALGENVFAGPSMRKRAVYMYGTSLKTDPEGLVGCGLVSAFRHI
jgi:alkyl sulfatase BDS1-like metallo-beta-lactamase superfamily hydrolase